MKLFGLVLESYGRYVKVKTKDGEVIIKSDKKAPKEGTKIEIKDFGQGDYQAKVLAKKPGDFDYLPNVKFVEIGERLVDETLYRGSSKMQKDKIVINIALFVEELSKRMEINNTFLQRFQKYLVDEPNGENNEFENYINLLSGKYGLKKTKEGIAFLNREKGAFRIFIGDDTITGRISGNEIAVYFSRMPENAEELEKKLRKYFSVVSFKLEGFVDGAYV